MVAARWSKRFSDLGFWWRPVARGDAALTIATGFWWRPVARGDAALTIATGFWWRLCSPADELQDVGAELFKLAGADAGDGDQCGVVGG